MITLALNSWRTGVKLSSVSLLASRYSAVAGYSAFQQRHCALRSKYYVCESSSSGFSLIELLAAVAVFSLVSVLTAQSLGISVSQRMVLEKIDDEARNLTWTLNLLRQDLKAAVPLSFSPSNGHTEGAFIMSDRKDEFHLSISGYPLLPAQAGAGFARVSWKFNSEDGVLERNTIPSLRPSASEASDSSQVMLKGVKQFVIEAVSEGSASEENTSQLPRGFVVTLVTMMHGTLTLQVTR